MQTPNSTVEYAGRKKWKILAQLDTNCLIDIKIPKNWNKVNIRVVRKKNGKEDEKKLRP